MTKLKIVLNKNILTLSLIELMYIVVCWDIIFDFYTVLHHSCLTITYIHYNMYH